MVTDNLIPEVILEAYDILLQYRIIANITTKIKLDETSSINRWFFRCNIKVPFPNKKAIPELVELEIVLFEDYPYSDVNCYSKCNVVQGFPHQDAESGKLCLKEKSLAPIDTKKLAIYVSWAKEWLIDAANDVLIRSTDPYELPDFSRKNYNKPLPSERVFLFREEKESFRIWENYITKYGNLKCNVPQNMRAIFVSDFYYDKPIPICSNVFSSALFDSKNDLWGCWVILKDIYYYNFRPPQTFGEIRELFKHNSIDFDFVLKKAWEMRNKSLVLSFVLIGFSIPQNFFGNPEEIHWAPLVFYTLEHARKLSQQKKTKSIWREVLKKDFADSQQLPWAKSSNIHHLRLFSRGSLNKSIQNKSISLFGCGALGSIIAENLIRGGNTDLSLFDYDIIQMGNLCRHTLSGEDLNYSKSIALRKKLLSINPFANIQAFYSSIPLNSKFTNEKEAIKKSDLLLECTTDDFAFEWLNKFVSTKNKRLISMFFNFHTDILTLLVSGTNISCIDIFNYLKMAVKNGDTKIDSNEYFNYPSKYEQIIEGIGCWHATFPGLYMHINLLVSAALDIINDHVDNEKGLAVIIKRNKSNTYLSNGNILEIAFYKNDFE